MSSPNAEIVRRCFEAYVKQKPDLWLSLVAENFRFTSPYDNRIDRRAFLRRCWPAGPRMAEIRLKRIEAVGNTVFVNYVARVGSGDEFTNAEIFTVRDGLVQEVEVYFGWSLPHPAAVGSWIDQNAGDADG